MHESFTEIQIFGAVLIFISVMVAVQDGRTWKDSFLFRILNIIKVSFLYPTLFGVIPFYLLFGRKGYQSIYSYFQHEVILLINNVMILQQILKKDNVV